MRPQVTDSAYTEKQRKILSDMTRAAMSHGIAKGERLPSTKVTTALAASAHHYFGSWNEAVKAAGYQPRPSNRTKHRQRSKAPADVVLMTLDLQVREIDKKILQARADVEKMKKERGRLMEVRRTLSS